MVLFAGYDEIETILRQVAGPLNTGKHFTWIGSEAWGQSLKFLGMLYWNFPIRNDHDDVIWWRHHMETFSALLVICEGNPPVTGGRWCGTLMFSLICWANNRNVGDLRRHRAHYDVTIMITWKCYPFHRSFGLCGFLSRGANDVTWSSTDKSTLVQVMAWCRQATCHYLSQCWTRSFHYMTSLGHNELMSV